MLRRIFSLAAKAESRVRDFRSRRAHKKYLADGRLPWTPGYHVEKERVIRQAVLDPNWDPYRVPEGYGFRLDDRVLEYPWFFSRLPDGPGRLLDAGSILNFSYLVDHPKLAQKWVAISTLAPEHQAFWKNGISYVYEDIRNSCFKDSFFDVICCLSTLEHVGLDNTRFAPGDETKLENNPDSCLRAVAEFRRLLKPGGTLFLSVPFGKAKNHKWFQVFDAAMIDKVIAAFAPATLVETIYRYRKEGWTVSDRASAADATYFDIHERKDYDEDYAAASRGLICLEMTMQQ